MTYLERYYGIQIIIENHLEPITLEILEDRAIRIALIKNIDINKFNVYYHKIHILDLEKRKHHSKRFNLEKRIKMLDVTFKVNKKQRKHGNIRFFNSYVGHNEDKGIYFFDGEYELRRIYYGASLKENLETELITFIDKDYVRPSHKKIKIEIMAQPTEEYKKTLTDNSFRSTDLDVPLTDEVRLNIRNFKIEEIKTLSSSDKVTSDENGKAAIILTINNLNEQEKKMGDTYNVETGFGVGPNATVNIEHNQVNNYKTPQNLNFNELVDELIKLRGKVVHNSVGKSDVDKFTIAANISEAIEVSKSENKDKNKIVSNLLKGGLWLLNTAKEIGVTLVADLIETNLGVK
jgi:hypothetical protein